MAVDLDDFGCLDLNIESQILQIQALASDHSTAYLFEAKLSKDAFFTVLGHAFRSHQHPEFA